MHPFAHAELIISSRYLSPLPVGLAFGLIVGMLLLFRRRKKDTANSDARGQALLDTIQKEARNARLCELLAGLFRDFSPDGSLPGIFQKMAAEERRHVSMLERLYHWRFGSSSLGNEPLPVDHRILEQILNAGMHRLLKEKMAEKRWRQVLCWFHLRVDGWRGFFQKVMRPFLG